MTEQLDELVCIGSDLKQLDRLIERALVDLRNVQAETRHSKSVGRRLDSAEMALQKALEKVRGYTETSMDNGSGN